MPSASDFLNSDEAAKQPPAEAQKAPSASDFLSDVKPPEGPSAASRFGSAVWEKANPVNLIKGAAQMVMHPINTYTADAQQREALAGQGKQDLQQGHYVDGAVRILNALVPFLGPQVQHAAERIQGGDLAGGAGEAVGIGTSMVEPKIAGAIGDATGLSGAVENATRNLYRGSLRIPKSEAGNAEALIDTGLENKIPVSKSGVAKINQLVSNLNDNVKAEIATDPTRPISTARAVQNTVDLESKFKNQVNPNEDLAAIADARNQFTQNNPGDIPAEQAQAMKQGTYRVLGGKAYGEIKTASVEAQKALARGLKEELANQFPALKDLNAKEGSLLDLQDVLEGRVNTLANQQRIPLTSPVLAAGAKAVTNSSGVAAAAGVMRAVLTPAVRSRIAIALSRASGSSVPAAAAQIGAYVGALGEADSAPMTMPRAADSQQPKPDSVQSKIIADLASAAKRRQDLTDQDRLSALANR